jgi:hypothetical protein
VSNAGWVAVVASAGTLEFSDLDAGIPKDSPGAVVVM